MIIKDKPWEHETKPWEHEPKAWEHEPKKDDNMNLKDDNMNLCDTAKECGLRIQWEFCWPKAGTVRNSAIYYIGYH